MESRPLAHNGPVLFAVGSMSKCLWLQHAPRGGQGLPYHKRVARDHQGYSLETRSGWLFPSLPRLALASSLSQTWTCGGQTQRQTVSRCSSGDSLAASKGCGGEQADAAGEKSRDSQGTQPCQGRMEEHSRPLDFTLGTECQKCFKERKQKGHQGLKLGIHLRLKWPFKISRPPGLLPSPR